MSSLYYTISHNVIPIVMGARPEDYRRSAPEHSYIHVEDFAGPKELAEYLHKLDQDDDLYNEYFQWKVTLFSIFIISVIVEIVSGSFTQKVTFLPSSALSTFLLTFFAQGTGQLIDTKFMCRVCAMLHDRVATTGQTRQDLDAWWQSPGTCTDGFWRDFRPAQETVTREEGHKELRSVTDWTTELQ